MKTFRILHRLVVAMLLCAFVVFPAAASTGASDGGTFLGLLGTVLGLGVVGLVVNEQALAGMKANFMTLFNNARSAYTPLWTKGAMEMPSTTSLNTYAWMEAFPKMREWLGDRYYKSLKAQAYNIINKTYESSVLVPRESVEDDQYGIYGPMMSAMGFASEQLWDDLFFALLNNGFTGLSYDGKAFFATNHASGLNKISGGTSTLATAGAYGSAIKYLKSVVDSENNPMLTGNERPTLWVPPALEETARILLNADYVSVSSGSTQNNPWKNSADLVVASKLTSATAWFLTLDFMGIKPLIVQKRRLPDFRAITNPDDASVRKTNKFEYIADARGNAGYGLHQFAFGSVGA